MYLTHTGSLFTVKPFYNLSLPLSTQPHSVVLCAWWNIHTMAVLHYGLWVIVLYLHDFLILI